MTSQLPSIDDPGFYAQAYASRLPKGRQGKSVEAVLTDDYSGLSLHLDLSEIQDPAQVRSTLRARRLAPLLFDAQGNLDRGAVQRAITCLNDNLYSLGPHRQEDALRREHLLGVLQRLYADTGLRTLLHGIARPTNHQHAERILRDTLGMPTGSSLTDAHARQAALTAWMSFLRQNVGSCFATAPAINIHTHQPELFLADVRELLNMGRLTRVFGGVEYSVPLSPSWGVGDLKKPFELMPDLTAVSKSPGLMAALEAAGLLDRQMTPAAKTREIRERLQRCCAQHLPRPTSADVLLQELLRDANGVTVEDLKEHELKSHSHLHPSLLMGLPKMSGKEKACRTYEQQLVAARTAFKALTDCALLKSWEFSVASFAESKADFVRWNLHASLGLGAQDAHGIGPSLYAGIERRLNRYNSLVQEYQDKYEQLFMRAKHLEGRLRRPSQEEVEWLRSAYNNCQIELDRTLDLRDEAHQKAAQFARLFPLLIEKYLAKFPDYFQEIYDADMQDVTTGPYDDSPAGFRLLYKHGRANTSLWTLIYSPSEFVDALTSFFVATEHEFGSDKALEGLRDDLSELVTAAVTQIRTREFLESALHRVAAAHGEPIVKNPLDHLDRIEKKPWVYVVGGAMDLLVNCYYKREQPLKKEERWVESPTDLLVFLVDTLKAIPHQHLKGYLQDPSRMMLVSSPTHAFLLRPGESPFKESWLDNTFTYTWVRDQLVIPRKQFVENLMLDRTAMRYLVEKWAGKVPIHSRKLFSDSFEPMPGFMGVPAFRQYAVARSAYGPSTLTADEIDGSLYAWLPLTPAHELRFRVRDVLSKLLVDESQAMELYDSTAPRLSTRNLFTSEELNDICLSLLILQMDRPHAAMNYPRLVREATQNLGWAMPPPIIVGDTNWVKPRFGFTVNPGTAAFELWRLDTLGFRAMPMSIWQHWMDGTRRDTWIVYTRPYEYGS